MTGMSSHTAGSRFTAADIQVSAAQLYLAKQITDILNPRLEKPAFVDPKKNGIVDIIVESRKITIQADRSVTHSLVNLSTDYGVIPGQDIAQVINQAVEYLSDPASIPPAVTAKRIELYQALQDRGVNLKNYKFEFTDLTDGRQGFAVWKKREPELKVFMGLDGPLAISIKHTCAPRFISLQDAAESLVRGKISRSE